MSSPPTAIANARANPLPAATRPSFGFKEWAIVCDALGQGRQSVILRKGGIAEGRDGFRFKHEAFFLFPTQYHQQSERVRPDAMLGVSRAPEPPEGLVDIRYFFALEWAFWIDDWATIERLEPFHVWRADVVRERFEYDGQRGLQCAFGRVYRLEPAWAFADRPAYGGCRSWVTLPEFLLENPPVPVLGAAPHEVVSRQIRAVIQAA